MATRRGFRWLRGVVLGSREEWLQEDSAEVVLGRLRGVEEENPGSSKDYCRRWQYGSSDTAIMLSVKHLTFVATMNKDALIRLVNEQMWEKGENDVPKFGAGDTITVTYRIVEGNKERLQSFRGVVIQIKGSGRTKMFTIRKVSNGVGVERIFPLYSPHIDKIEVNKYGVVRRARIYYLRDLTGKKARIKERRMKKTE